MILNLLGTFYNSVSGRAELQRNGDTTAPSDETVKSSVSSMSVPKKFKDDIEALTAAYGALNEGLTIDINLQDLLEICPRERRRIDAYTGLTSYLAKRGITLTIKSRKTK
mgnify:CR=1 FL=1